MKKFLMAVALLSVMALPAAAQSIDLPLLSARRLSLGVGAEMFWPDASPVLQQETRVKGAAAYQLTPKFSLQAGAAYGLETKQKSFTLGGVLVLKRAG